MLVRNLTNLFTLPTGGLYSMKRSKLYLISFAVLVTAWSSLFAQTRDFYVSGTVQDASGKPLGGATASLTSLANRLSWDFSDSATGHFGMVPAGISSPFSGNRSFSLPSATVVRAELFGVSGKKIATLFNGNLDKGAYSFTVPSELSATLARNVYIVKITAGSTVTFQKLLNTGGRSNISIGNASGSGRNGSVKKMAAGPAVDTLRVGKTGYVAVKVPITSDTFFVGTVTLTKINIDSEVTALMAKMSNSEFVGQLVQIDCPTDADVTGKTLGTIFGGGGDGPVAGGTGTPAQWSSFNDHYRSLGSQLKSPILTEWDVVHGFGKCNGATIYPHNIGLGATWDTTIVQKCYRVGGIESRGCGVLLGYGPCIAVPQDYRWGRVYEGFSASPVLTQAMARAAVLGYQTTDLSNPLAFAGCVKHFAGDGGSLYGLNPGTTVGTEATLESIHLPGYTAAIKAGVAAIMASYSIWDSSHSDSSNCTEDKALLTDWLKTGQGFDGYVNSDWSAVYQWGNDVLTSFRSGLDVPMLGANADNQSPTITQSATTLLNNGGTDQARIKDAVARVLRLKYKMDLFNQPQSTNADLTALVGCQAHRDIAREAVRKSLVLLKTTAGLLPLSKTAKITLVGPKSQDVGVQCGGWTLGWQGAVGLDPTGSTNIMQGFQSIGGASNISYSADGTGITGDVAVVCIGEVPYAETLGDIVDGTVDNHSLAIPDADFVTNAKNSGKPVVCIMLTGRPMDITGIMTADAIVAAWLPGTEGGGIAEVLYGNYEFSGKLGMAWPANATSEPTENGTGGTPPRFPYDYGLKSNGTQLPGGLY